MSLTERIGTGLAVNSCPFRRTLACLRRRAGVCMQHTENEGRQSKSPWHAYITSLAFVALMISCFFWSRLLILRPRPSKSPEIVTVLVAAEDLHQGMKLDEPEKLFL